jgi:hypothetical protein
MENPNKMETNEASNCERMLVSASEYDALFDILGLGECKFMIGSSLPIFKILVEAC